MFIGEPPPSLRSCSSALVPRVRSALRRGCSTCTAGRTFQLPLWFPLTSPRMASASSWTDKEIDGNALAAPAGYKGRGNAGRAFAGHHPPSSGWLPAGCTPESRRQQGLRGGRQLRHLPGACGAGGAGHGQGLRPLLLWCVFSAGRVCQAAQQCLTRCVRGHCNASARMTRRHPTMLPWRCYMFEPSEITWGCVLLGPHAAGAGVNL